MDICSLIVHSKPGCLEAVIDYLKSSKGTDIIDFTPEGKIVVVLEDTPETTVANAIDNIQCHKDILSVMMVYQQTDNI